MENISEVRALVRLCGSNIIGYKQFFVNSELPQIGECFDPLFAKFNPNSQDIPFVKNVSEVELEDEQLCEAVYNYNYYQITIGTQSGFKEFLYYAIKKPGENAPDRFYINFQEGESNNFFADTIEEAKEEADEASFCTECDILIESTLTGKIVCRRCWHDSPVCVDYPDGEIYDIDDPITFGDYGYYGDWE